MSVPSRILCLLWKSSVLYYRDKFVKCNLDIIVISSSWHIDTDYIDNISAGLQSSTTNPIVFDLAELCYTLKAFATELQFLPAL